MAQNGKLESFVSIKLTRAMRAQLEQAAASERRRPAEWARNAVEDALTAHFAREIDTPSSREAVRERKR